MSESVKPGTPASRAGARLGSVAAATLALVLLGYIGVWAVITLQLRAGVLDWIAAREAEGYRVTHSGVGVGGFPRFARVTVGAPVIAAPDGRALNWSWAGGQATVETSALHPDALSLRLSGGDAVSINVGGKLRTYRGTADELSFGAHGRGASSSLSLTVRNLVMVAEEPGDLVEVEHLTARGESLEPPRTAEPGASYGVTIRASGIQLPRQFDLPLGEAIADLDADAVIAGPFAPRQRLPDALARWRDGGGVMELSQVSLRYGPLLLEGSGTISLDGDMQPVGAFATRIQGFQQTLAALAGRGIIDEPAAARAKTALALLGRPGGGDGLPTLSVPLSLNDRRLSVGPLPLMTVPLIEWPRGPSPRTGELPPMAGSAAG